MIRRVLYNCPRGGDANGAFIKGIFVPLDRVEVHFDDALWAYSIRAFEEWRNCDVNQWLDPVVDCLMLMGCPDWVNPDNWTASSIQPMWFVTVWGPRLQQRIIHGEVEVIPALYILGLYKALIFLHRLMPGNVGTMRRWRQSGHPLLGSSTVSTTSRCRGTPQCSRWPEFVVNWRQQCRR